ncbi:MAG: alpha/beta hydrolase [Bacteroidota bacterium]
MKRIVLFILTFLFLCIFGEAQNVTLPLWEKDIPNYRSTNETEQTDTNGIVRISNVQKPDMAVYLPSKSNATGQAVVICPGGGYSILAYDWEGTDIAKWLNSEGIAGIVLKYRLPGSESNIVRHKSPLLDAQRAIRLTRYHAGEWNIDPDRVGVMGFSAGGHLASTLGTHFDERMTGAEDPAAMASCRPDFMVLVYSVISFDPEYGHMGSRNNLLGEDPGQQLVDRFSNEKQVTPNTPPTFLIHAGDDEGVPVQNSLMFYKALQENDVPAEMHIYPEGGHGFGLALENEHLHTWTDLCIDWMKNLEE